MKLSSFLLHSFATLGLLVAAGSSYAHDGHDMSATAAVSKVSKEPPPKLFLDGPIPELLPLGLMVVTPRVENLRVSNITGEGALQVEPRIGHFHVELDKDKHLGSWAIYDGSSIGINHLSKGPHQLTVVLSDPTHKEWSETSKTINFVIP